MEVAAAPRPTTWIFRGGGVAAAPRPRDVDIPWKAAAAPRPTRGYFPRKAATAEGAFGAAARTRRRVFAKRLSAWSDTPADAASEMIATNFRPELKWFRSTMFARLRLSSLTLRCRYTTLPPSSTNPPVRPVISATLDGPPSSCTRRSSTEFGRLSFCAAASNFFRSMKLSL